MGTNSNKVLLAHPGTQYSAQLARQLHRTGHLWRFWTGFALTAGGLRERALAKLLPAAHHSLHNRILAGMPSDKLRIIPHLEAGYLAAMRLGWESQRAVHWRNSRFQRAIPEAEIKRTDLGIGFDTSSDILIDRFHRVGKPFYLDQTIAHPKAKAAIYARIAPVYPAWTGDLETRDSTVSAGEEKEHRMADRIIVASSFTKETLMEQGVPESKLSVNPYGVDLERFRVRQKQVGGRPFRFLFAGLVSARKGIPLLLDAWRALAPADAELIIAGPVSHTAPTRWLTSVASARYVGKLSNADLAQLMAESDVFVFPSYFEGFALVLLEAMACGLTVITTTATAGPDIVAEGKDGWIIQPGDLEALVTAMRRCLDDRDLVHRMGEKARATAERFTWDAFGQRWSRLLALPA